jgi:hypothetical protein
VRDRRRVGDGRRARNEGCRESEERNLPLLMLVMDV